MLDSYATTSLQGGRTDGLPPSLGWTDPDGTNQLYHPTSPRMQSQSQYSVGNQLYDRRYDVATAVHDRSTHLDDSILSTGTDVDVEDDSQPLINAIGMSNGELKQALYVSQEELSTMRDAQSSLRTSYRHLEPSIMELMQEHNVIHAQVNAGISSHYTPNMITIFHTHPI